MNRYKLFKAGVDVNKGLERVGGSREFYEALLEKFSEDGYFAEMERAMKQGDTRQAFQCAHALKGAAGNLSFCRLYESLIPLVEALRTENMEEAHSLLGEVEAAYSAVIEALQ